MKLNIKTKFNIGDKVQSKYHNKTAGEIIDIQVNVNDSFTLITYVLIKDNGLSLSLNEDSVELIEQ